MQSTLRTPSKRWPMKCKVFCVPCNNHPDKLQSPSAGNGTLVCAKYSGAGLNLKFKGFEGNKFSFRNSRGDGTHSKAELTC